MKVKRSIIEPKSGIFESNDKHIKFIDTNFPNGFTITSKKCKSLSFSNCFLDNVIIKGEFESIYFDHCKVTLMPSLFSCKSISNNASYLMLYDTIIEGLESVKIYGNGFFLYSNPTHPLSVLNNFSVDDKSTFELKSSILITNFLCFSKGSMFYATNTNKDTNLELINSSVTCNTLIFDDDCKSRLYTNFCLNGIPMKHLKTVMSNEEMLKLGNLCKLETLLKYLAMKKEL